MTTDREDAALDALIASFFVISPGDELIPLDDPAILSDEDRASLESLGTSEELIGRLYRPEWSPEVVAEMDRHRQEMLDDDFDDAREDA